MNRVFVYYPLIGHNQETLTVRECTPTWFAANPACLHRLVPFLARELLALLWNDERTIEHIIQEVLTTIQIHEIRSLVLTRKLSEYLGRYTKHFLHEFYTFASCPYDLAGFDRYAQYPNINASTQVTTPLQIELGDDDGDEETPIIIDETTDLAINTVSSCLIFQYINILKPSIFVFFSRLILRLLDLPLPPPPRQQRQQRHLK